MPHGKAIQTIKFSGYGMTLNLSLIAHQVLQNQFHSLHIKGTVRRTPQTFKSFQNINGKMNISAILLRLIRS